MNEFLKWSSMCLLVFLVGCTQAPVTSRLTFKQAQLSEEDLQSIVSVIEKFAKEESADCTPGSNKSFLIECRHFSSSGRSEVYARSNKEAVVSIFVYTMGVPLFPPTISTLERGNYLPPGHRELENWLFSSFDSFPVEEKARAYDGRNVRIVY